MKTDYFYYEPELLDAVRANDDDYIAALKQARDILADGLEQLRIAEEQRIFNELKRIVGGWK